MWSQVPLCSPQHRADDTFLYRLCGEWRLDGGDVEETTADRKSKTDKVTCPVSKVWQVEWEC